MGVPPDELMASLFEAIVMQNLSVLTRGNTLRPVVLLLGGPNIYIRGMRDCWKHNIPKIWEERKTPLPEGTPPEDLIQTPENAQYFAALGAIEFGKAEDRASGRYLGREQLQWYIEVGRDQEKAAAGGSGGGLAKDAAELAAFKEQVPAPQVRRRRRFRPARSWRALSASTAAPPPPRPCCFRRQGARHSLPSPTSFPRATPSKTPSRCSTSWRSRLPRRAPR